MKSLLKTIAISVMLVTFITTTVLFVCAVGIKDQLMVDFGFDYNTEEVLEKARWFEDYLKQHEEIYIVDKASKNIELDAEHPTQGFGMMVLTTYALLPIIAVYELSLITGVTVGIIVHMVFIEKKKVKKLLKDSLIAFVILFAIILLINVLHALYWTSLPVNGEWSVAEIVSISGDIFFSLFKIYAQFVIGAYVVHLIYQFIKAKKLDKALNDRKQKIPINEDDAKSVGYEE